MQFDISKGHKILWMEAQRWILKGHTFHPQKMSIARELFRSANLKSAPKLKDRTQEEA